MSCDIPIDQLYLYLDGELLPSEALTIERHLHACETCQQEAAAQQRVRALLRSTLTRGEAPEHLWTAIRRQLPDQPLDSGRPSRWWPHQPLMTTLAVVAALVVLVVGMRVWFAPAMPAVVQEMVDSQIRSRLMEAPYKRISADPGAIRRWFRDKVAFSILVPQVAKEHYTFQGVRLNYFLDRRVAEIAYTSDGHMLSFLMFSGQHIPLTSMRTVHAGDRVFYVQTYKGYKTVLWKDGTLFCSLVSDVPLSTLLHLARQATGSDSTS